MDALLRLARWVDALNDRFAWFAQWAVFASCAISAGNAVMRYLFDSSSNAWLEIQWYLFAACVMFGAAQVLRLNEHVRVDVIYGRWPARAQVFIDLFGLVFFFMPVMLLMLGLSTPLFVKWYVTGEMSSNAGGLVRWPAMLTLPLGFGLLTLQGAAEIVKRLGWLAHRYEMDTHYDRPLQ
ncbi:MAG TPA: TRAP transporter small permease subunit [Methylibium sp.]|uniref:TRAP transporter small permease subunit n=1 Tax=Methylibium sp. TaxID=2067992 RepID=UPI002DBD3B3E|nr:TRAP transporter small permease subunit [Methylibium sp.]HEU4459140.1 TRAP transporter small permease subunit [Methylibium sp.]